MWLNPDFLTGFPANRFLVFRVSDIRFSKVTEVCTWIPVFLVFRQIEPELSRGQGWWRLSAGSPHWSQLHQGPGQPSSGYPGIGSRGKHARHRVYQSIHGEVRLNFVDHFDFSLFQPFLVCGTLVRDKKNWWTTLNSTANKWKVFWYAGIFVKGQWVSKKNKLVW